MTNISKLVFEQILTKIANSLTKEAQTNGFISAKSFENRVRQLLKKETLSYPDYSIDLNPPDQIFPDIPCGEFGIEVKFTTSDNWRCIGNSIQETQRVQSVKYIYLMYGKMGGTPEVRWQDYESSIVHVRTSHVPRFEVQIQNSGNKIKPLFTQIGIHYDDFRTLPIEEKMSYIRSYAKKIHPDGRLWWIGEDHTTPAQARLYTNLSKEEKIRYRAEAAIVCPQIVGSGRNRKKYDDVVLYLLTYRGILCHQARDLFSAGSVAIPGNKDRGGLYIARSLKLIEKEMAAIAPTLEDSIFKEYWHESVPPEFRLRRWLEKADSFATNWKPSDLLFKELIL